MGEIEMLKKLFDYFGLPTGVFVAALITIWRIGRYLAPLGHRVVDRHVTFLDETARLQAATAECVKDTAKVQAETAGSVKEVAHTIKETSHHVGDLSVAMKSLSKQVESAIHRS